MRDAVEILFDEHLLMIRPRPKLSVSKNLHPSLVPIKLVSRHYFNKTRGFLASNTTLPIASTKSFVRKAIKGVNQRFAIMLLDTNRQRTLPMCFYLSTSI